jgi:hypothetical protein
MVMMKDVGYYVNFSVSLLSAISAGSY